MGIQKSITSKLTTKAQTTVPQEIRMLLQLRPGDQLEYRVKNGQVELIRSGQNAEDWLKANRDALLEMAAWDREHEIFAPDQRLF